ncbi:hypothetical protein LTR78_006229 [Recurvomyces mirabilis]|uniref:Uncharacterized protein n=1 Tax=Recurvomyces mirabilis TaxID=574656 RepID=A0AAE0WLR8_9PEZI|nr:hypothetical protein LTR78_006229 [Recurvomyces mirabilis]KAK5152070.1 hypothetical protein LTS14_008845 [Recurvomyces mirabilis]
MEGSGMRRLLIDYYSSRSDVEEVCADLQSEAAPKDLLRILVQAFKRNCHESEARRKEWQMTAWSPDTPARAIIAVCAPLIDEYQHEAELESKSEFEVPA